MFTPMRWLLSLSLLVALSSNASATLFSFSAISNNSTNDVLTDLEAQLVVDVTDPGGNEVDFKFMNLDLGADTVPSSITGVYFDDGTLLKIASITNGSGVSFSQGASPGNLPGGNNITPAFQATAGFTADSDPAVQPNGVNPGEFVIITFDLLAGKTFADTIDALGDGTLRIGIHVQGLPNDESDSFVSPPPEEGPLPIPEPTSIAAWLVGCGGLGLILRRLWSKAAA